MKKIILGVLVLVFLAVAARASWAYYKFSTYQESSPTTQVAITEKGNEVAASTPTQVILSTQDLKAKKDLEETISTFTNLVKEKCTNSNPDKQCDVVKSIITALSQKCLILTKENEINNCIFEFGGGAIFSQEAAVNTSPGKDISVSVASTASREQEGVSNLSVQAGDSVDTYWESKNADSAYIDVSLKCTNPALDDTEPTKKVPTESYQSMRSIPEKLSGCIITYKITVKNTASEKEASATSTITIK